MAVTIVRDDTAKLIKSIKELAQLRVMVGIPAGPEKAQGVSPGPNQRTDGPVTNALLGYLHEHGSPAANIPARPHLVPGVESALPKIQQYLRAAARAAADGKSDLVMRNLHAAGLAGQSAVRLKITQGPFAPLAPSTVAARMRKVSKVGGKVSAGFAAITPLVDTAQLRAAYAYVIRKVRG